MRLNVMAIHRYRVDLIDRRSDNELVITHPTNDNYVTTTGTGLVTGFGDTVNHHHYDESRVDHRSAVSWAKSLGAPPPVKKVMRPETRIRICKQIADVEYFGRVVVKTVTDSSGKVGWCVTLSDGETVTIDHYGLPVGYSNPQVSGTIPSRLIHDYTAKVDRRIRYLRDRLKVVNNKETNND